MNLSSRLGSAASFPRCSPVLFLALWLAGCGREGIRVYRVPKEKSVVASERHERVAPPAMQWKTPPGWKEQSAGGMRTARFSVPGKDGQEADVSVIPLGGITAKTREIVNLWREQIHLGEIKEDELASQLEKIEMGPGQADLFDMVSPEPLPGEKFKKRILVAMLPQGSTTWFFKMTGEDELVREQKPVFLTFLKSLTFEPGGDAAPAAAPDFTASGGNSAAAPAPGEGAPKPDWQVPSDWKEQPPSQMLLAKFLLNGDSGAQAEVTVSVFPGDTGGLLANVNRWRGQVGLAPVEQSEIKQLPSVDVIGGKATLVDVTGISAKSGKKARLIGAVVPREASTWFYKMVGDEQVAEQQKTAFLKFLQSARYPNAG